MKYQILDWDSNFFGFKVAYIMLTNEKESDLDSLLSFLKEKEITLVYVSSINSISQMNDLFEKYCGYLVDNKVTYVKMVDRNIKVKDNIVIYKLQYPTAQMLNLAIESGVYSRFNIDKRIDNDKYEDLYKMWITNSVNHSIAKDVIVFKEQNNILGMVTLSEKNQMADVGIIAVETKMRGRGIGRDLMKAAENWAFKKSYKYIQVVTQRDNRAACSLYEKIGFSINRVNYYYHFWLKKNNF